MARPSLLLALSIYAVTSSQSPTSFTVQDPKNYKNTSRISQPLTFNQDGTFQISIFEDLHFGESKLHLDRGLHRPRSHNMPISLLHPSCFDLYATVISMF